MGFFFDRIYKINRMRAQFSAPGQRWRRKASTLTSEVDADEKSFYFSLRHLLTWGTKKYFRARWPGANILFILLIPSKNKRTLIFDFSRVFLKWVLL